MTTYRVTGTLFALVMIEVTNTDMTTSDYEEISVNEIVDAHDFDTAREEAEAAAKSGYDVKRSYWQSGPYLEIIDESKTG